MSSELWLAAAHSNGKASNDAGALQPISAMILTAVLYAARVARPDLLKASHHLANMITR